MADPEINMETFENTLKRLEESIDNISRKGYGYYKEDNLYTLHNKMESDNLKALSHYQKLVQAGTSRETNADVFSYINELYNGDSIPEPEDLLELYSKLCYDFQSAYKEIFGLYSEASPQQVRSELRMIQFCKNVQIMEDMINKICNNNIDKSIVKGERHFDSMKYGFEWLFCQSDSVIGTTDMGMFHHVDIRDKTRFLDYIKYQIKVSCQEIKKGPRTSSEVDDKAAEIEDCFNRMGFTSRIEYINHFKQSVKELIESFFTVYNLLIEFRDNLFLEEEIRHWLVENGKIDKEKAISDRERFLPSNEMMLLSDIALRVLIDRFVSFVKINDLNFGNSTFDHAWFNYSELSDSNYAGSNFESVRIENALIKHCDLSTCNFSEADLSGTDFTGSNFNYSNLTAVNFVGSILNQCQFQNAVFRDPNMDSYSGALNSVFSNSHVKRYCERHNLGNKVLSRYYKANTARDIIWIEPTGQSKDIRSLIFNSYSSFPVVSIEDSIKRQSGVSLFKSISFEFSKNMHEIYTLTKEYIAEYLSSVIPKIVLDELSMFLLGIEQDSLRKDREKSNGKIRFDLATLENASIKQSQMSGMDFSHVNMKNASFEDSDLSGSKMFYTYAEAASFIRSNLNNTKNCESYFVSANFSNAIANNSEFINCKLYGTNWNCAILLNTLFLDATKELEDKLTNSEETTSFYLSTYLNNEIDEYQKVVLDSFIDSVPNGNTGREGTENDRTPTKDGWQHKCSIGNSKFERALLDNSSFINISSDKSSFNESSMKNAFLANCSFHLSDFVQTDLRYAFITFCSLGDSNFSQANATLSKINYVEFCNANLSRALFNNADMDHVLFSGANLNGLNFTKAIIKNCAFVSCNMESIIFQEARFENCIFENLNLSNPIGLHSALFNNCKAFNCQHDASVRAVDGLEFVGDYDD